MIMRGDFSEEWSVVTRYADLGNGQFRAIQKHPLAESSANQLSKLLKSHEILCRILDAKGWGLQDLLDELDLSDSGIGDPL